MKNAALTLMVVVFSIFIGVASQVAPTAPMRWTATGVLVVWAWTLVAIILWNERVMRRLGAL